jgi:hypothetical protein
LAGAPNSLLSQEVHHVAARRATQHAEQQKQRSFVDRSGSRNRGFPDTSTSEDAFRDSHEDGKDGGSRDGVGGAFEGWNEAHPDMTIGDTHHATHGADHSGGLSELEGKPRVNDGDISKLLELQDGHRTKSLAEREKEADAFCSRKDLTKKEIEGCKVRKNATRMNDYGLHLTEAMRMKRVVKASERVAHRAETRAEQEARTLKDLQKSLESRRVSRVHDRTGTQGRPDYIGNILFFLLRRKIAIAVIFLVGAIFVTCINVYYGKNERPPQRRLRLHDYRDEAPAPATRNEGTD